MTIIAIENTAISVADLANTGPVVLTRNDQPVVAVNALAGADWESIRLASNPHFIALIEDARREYREQGGVTLEEVRTELGLKLAPARRSRKKASRGRPQ